MKASTSLLGDATQQLPSGPPTLCFDKEMFMKKEFNVELFIVECRRRVSLEMLRDDLSIYLKILQSAMIELINKDYADFVNLSTNLVGVDKALTSLTTPLEQLREDVMNVSTALDEVLAEVDDKMRKQRVVRAKKTLLQQLISMLKAVDKIEKLLGLQSSEDYGPRELDGHLLERVGAEFNKLQYFVNKCRGMPLVEEIKPRMSNITACVQLSLESWLKRGLDDNDSAILGPCLRTYATIDKVHDAHLLFRQHVVRPYMEEIISEEAVNKDGGLEAMYDCILRFVPDHCKSLLNVTSMTHSASASGEVVHGYDFLVNSVWPEIVCNIEARTASIFAPGNPQMFHQRYTSSMAFVTAFERLCRSQASVKRLRSHPSFATFMSKWSLPVYFQIRFQEIAGSLETALNSAFDKTKEGSNYQLVASETVWSCIQQCWAPHVYLPPLSHRFWKLSLQLMARYATWMAQMAQQLPKMVSTSKHPPAEGNGKTNEEGDQLSTADVVKLMADSHHLADNQILEFFNGTVKPLLQELGVQDMTTLEGSVEDACAGLRQWQPALSQFIIDELSSQCIQSLKTVTDIPRLYRRTNREVPSKSSSYVNGVVDPLAAFVKTHGDVLDEEITKQWLHSTVNNTVQSYLSTTTDVLTSVKKMEDSLKRLKKGKGAGVVGGMTDDDKIRLQLYLDVTHFKQQVTDIGVNHSNMEAFTKLTNIVEEAAKKGSADSS